MIVSTTKLFALAYGRFAIGAYNVNNLEQVVGLFRGNLDSQAPFILQISKGARQYTDRRLLEALVRTCEEVYPEAVFAVHLDHGDLETCLECIESGVYSSVMIDGSALPYEDNVRVTQIVVEAAHARGIAVEAELGKLGGVEEHVTVKESEARLTDPDQAREFVARTGCDSLAVAIGTSHGAYKFSGTQVLRLDVLREIQKRLPGYPLVLHGASSIPPEEVRRINAAGGSVQGAQGVREEDIAKAIPLGVTKVNIDTDGRLVWTRVHREFFRDHPDKFDLREPGKVFMAEYARYIAHKNEILGSAGRLTEVKRTLTF